MVKKLFKILTDKSNAYFFNNCFYQFIIFFAVFALYALFIETNGRNDPYFNLFIFLLTTYCLVKYYLSCKQSFVPMLNRKLSLSIHILIGYLFTSVIWKIIAKLMFHFYGRIEVLNQQILDKRVQENPETIVFHLLLAIIAAPIMEEIIYRGLLLNAILYISNQFGISRNKSFTIFLFSTALLFSSAHASNNLLTFLGFSLTGLLLGFLYIISGSLIVPITVHFINNLSAELSVNDDTKRFFLFIFLLVSIILIEHFSKDENNFVKKYFCKT